MTAIMEKVTMKREPNQSSSWPLSRTYWKAADAGDEQAEPM